MKVVVVGAGVGGLAASVRLALAGCRVTLLEKNDSLGGKLNRRRLDAAGGPFTFDTGPSLLTLPFVFDELFAAAGRNFRGDVPLVRLDPVSRFVWPDGTTFHLRQHLDDTLGEVRRLAPRDVDGWRRFHDFGRRVWDLSGDLFLRNAPEQLLADSSGSALRRAARGVSMLTVPLRIGMFRTLASKIDACVRDPRLRAVLYQYATYSGASPWKVPATLAVIPFAEAHFGGWYVRGGMYQLAEALADLARAVGVDVQTGTPVRRIRISDGRAAGVETGDAFLPADAVVVNTDAVAALRNLVDPADRPSRPDRKLDALDPGGSGCVLLLGTNRAYPHLAHHTKFMPDDYAGRDGDLRAMFDGQTLPADPCLYVCASSRTDPTQAPAGGENVFVLASAPALWGKGSRVDWSDGGQAYRDTLVGLLETRYGAHGLPGLGASVMAEDRLTPVTLRDHYGANAGGIYGVGGNSRLAALRRPPNRDPDVKGLFYAGGATHPGGGLPLVALSGDIAARMVIAPPAPHAGRRV